MPSYWLFKSEPSAWSWQQHQQAGVAEWDGVRNYQARNFMRKMRVGDKGFFYHSVTEKRLVGIVEVVRPYYPDPSDVKGVFGMVDLRAVCSLPRPVSLAQIKAEPRLQHLALLKQARLSVMPIDAEAWALLLACGGVKDVV